MEKKNVVFLTVLAVATLLTAVVGTTFAYFTATVSGNNSAQTTTITTANNLGITFSDGADISDSNIVPGWKSPTSKTITVTNNGDATVNYQIDWINVNNTFSKGTSNSDDFVYSLTKKVGSGSASNVIGTTGYAAAASTKALAEGFTKVAGKAYSAPTAGAGVTIGTDATVIPVAAAPTGSGTTTASLVPSTSIASGEVHTYVLTMYFAETGVAQDENQSSPASCTVPAGNASSEACTAAGGNWVAATNVTFSAKLKASIVATDGIHAGE